MSDSPPVRPRRPPVRPLFDPVVQPWVMAPPGLGPVARPMLEPGALRLRFASPPVWTPEISDENRRPFPGREGPPVQAAVLVPLVDRPSGPGVLLTQRSAHLNDHAGQVSFPGGRMEAWDNGPIDTALRETEEETGLARSHVEILGALPEYRTGTGFAVTPVVGLATPGFTLTPDPREVAEVFEVPLAFLMDPGHHRLHTAELPDGSRRSYYSMPWGPYFVWGATAAMLRNLYHLLRA